MATNLAFHDVHFNVINRNNQIWLTAPEIAQALEYANENAVSRIYARNLEEFTTGMTEKVKLTSSRKSTSYDNLQNETRIFSLRGAHLIAMFARTPVAKEFRKWVLDILDKEVGNPQYTPEAPELFSHSDADNLARLLATRPGWASDLPLSAGGFEAYRYKND